MLLSVLSFEGQLCFSSHNSSLQFAYVVRSHIFRIFYIVPWQPVNQTCHCRYGDAPSIPSVRPRGLSQHVPHSSPQYCPFYPHSFLAKILVPDNQLCTSHNSQYRFILRHQRAPNEGRPTFRETAPITTHYNYLH